MIRIFCALAVAAALAGAFATSVVGADEKAAEAKTPALNFKMNDIDGKPVDLTTYGGKVILMVNVASKCGNTPQYTGLEALYEKYKDQGFVIIGFPANNFGGQEPGTDADIKKFCTAEDSKYKVKFPLMSKISVKGEDSHPLYKYLTSVDTKPKGKGDVTWNFEKFLIGKDGTVIGRFSPKTQPNDAALVSAVEGALK